MNVDPDNRRFLDQVDLIGHYSLNNLIRVSVTCELLVIYPVTASHTFHIFNNPRWSS